MKKGFIDLLDKSHVVVDMCHLHIGTLLTIKPIHIHHYSSLLLNEFSLKVSNLQPSILLHPYGALCLTLHIACSLLTKMYFSTYLKFCHIIMWATIILFFSYLHCLFIPTLHFGFSWTLALLDIIEARFNYCIAVVEVHKITPAVWWWWLINFMIYDNIISIRKI